MKARDAIDVLARHRGDAVAVCALGMAANAYGVDSRDVLPDDHHR